MLKAHARLFKQLTLAADVVVIAACWVLAYWLRFYSGVFGHGDIPPFRDYALQLVPVLLVWGFAFKAFDLYRPLRLGSQRSKTCALRGRSAGQGESATLMSRLRPHSPYLPTGQRSNERHFEATLPRSGLDSVGDSSEAPPQTAEL